jgi:glutaminase
LLESIRLNQAQFDQWLAEAREQSKTGHIPGYIPRLATVDPTIVAIAANFLSAEPLRAGSIEQPFVLMSVIKPLVLLFLLEQVGQEEVFGHVGMLPSDQSFHSLAQLSNDRGFPRNPMLNSGAIALADCLPGADGVERCQNLCQWLNRQSGAALRLDRAMLESVRSLPNETNRAIAHFLIQSGYLHSVDLALDTYNHICCLSGTVVDLTKLGMLLAAPQPHLNPIHQQIVNALMLTCGLYEASGAFAAQIGVPTKSGISGALLAVVPRVGAIACYSPALDATGNSVAGLFLLERLTQHFSFNLFGVLPH